MLRVGLIALLLPAASALLVQPALIKPSTHATKVPMMGLGDVKDAVLPATTEKTLSNFFGYQALGWGLAGVVFPTQLMVSLFGATPSPTGLVLMRGMSITNLCLGSKICKGTDEDAAATGFLFLAAWTYIINKFLAAGVIGAFSAPIMTFNAIGALVAARRSGGLFKTVTALDMDALSNLLPRDQEMSTRNLVGMQLLSWGIISTFFSSVLFGPMLLGCALDAVMPIFAAGIGLGNILLGGRVMGGDDSSAASVGAIVFGGWAVLSWLGKAAGLLTGKYLLSITIWNAVFALYCLAKA